MLIYIDSGRFVNPDHIVQMEKDKIPETPTNYNWRMALSNGDVIRITEELALNIRNNIATLGN